MGKTVATLRAIQVVLATGLVVTVVLSLLLGLVGSRMLMRPFEHLSEQARKVIHEDYDSIEPFVSICDEISELSVTLAKMANTIKIREELLNEQTEELMSTEEMLRDLNQNLEDRVTERTAQLEQATEELTWLNKDLESRSTALEEVNHQLEAFSYSVSHDLRAPLRHISGFIDILTEEYSDRLDQQGKEHLQRIAKGGKRMDELITAILEFSRVSRQALNRIDVDFKRLINELMIDFKGEIEQRGIDVEIGPMPPCLADPVLLRQVFVNLVGNAVKYTRKTEKPKIVISSKVLEDEILFSVSDNGSGFDMKYSDKLFNVFQRLHSSDEFEGTGIGLAIVQNIVNRHGGKIWAESTPGEGATFFFTILL
jgi:signal transduction histidine kinase